MKRLIVIAAAGGLLGLQGCAVEDDVDTDSVGTTTQRLECPAPDAGIDETKAALAVAMAEELGELDPVRQLEVRDGKLALKWGVCPGECPKTQGLLDLQDESWMQVFPQSTFNATVFRNELVASLDRQRNYENDLLNNNPGLIPADHALRVVHKDANECDGVDYTFQVSDPSCSGDAVAGPIFEIKAAHSGKCLDIAWGSADAGANAQQYECHGLGAQQFQFVDVGEGYNLIRNVNSGKCLDVAYWSSADGANIQQWDCHGGNNQQFRIVDAGGGKVGLVNRHSGKGIEVSGWSMDNVANVAQWTFYASNDNKVFYLNQIGWLTSGDSGDCPYSGDVSLLKNRLVMFGGDSNPYLAFSSSGSTITIDPDLADTGDVSTSDNSATCSSTNLCRVWDPNYLRTGCCTCPGVGNGQWVRYARNPGYAMCRAL